MHPGRPISSPGPQPPHPPVLAAGTVGGERLGEDGHLLPPGKTGTPVPWELQLHGCVEQGEVAPHDQCMRGACGNSTKFTGHSGRRGCPFPHPYHPCWASCPHTTDVANETG